MIPGKCLEAHSTMALGMKTFLLHLKLVEVNHKKVTFDTISVEICVLGRSKEYQK